MKFCLYLLVLSISFILISCSGESTPDLSTFDGIIEYGGEFEIVNEEFDETETGSFEEIIDGNPWRCTTKTIKAESALGGENGYPTYNPNASVIYPGSLLQGGSLDQGTPDVVLVDRAGGIISTDIIDGNIEPFFEVVEISKGRVAGAVNNIIANSTGIIPANFNFSYSSVQSEEEFALKAKVSVKKLGTSLKGKLDFSTEKEYNRYFITLNQSYYTMSYDLPTSWERVFAPTVTPEDLLRYTEPGNPICYISDVTYGRIFTMLVESTSSSTDVSAAIEGAFRGIGTKVEGEVDINYFESLKELKIQVFAFGGKDQQTLETVGVQGNLTRLVELLSEASDIRAAKPISYVVRSAFDNKIVNTKLATEYDTKDCIPTVDADAPSFTRHWAGLASTFGGVGAVTVTQGTEMLLFNLAGDQYMLSDIDKLEGPFPVSNLANNPLPVDGISAISKIWKNNSKSLCIDESGGRFFYLENRTFSEPQPISAMAPENPLLLDGIGSAYLLGEDASGANSIISFIGISSEKFAFYTPQIPAFGFSGTVTTDPLEDYGAIGVIHISSNDLIAVTFNRLGTLYTVTRTVGADSQIEGPFRI